MNLFPVSPEVLENHLSITMNGQAKADLESKGFVAQEYNYDGLLSVAAHTIGHRTVEINDIETNNNNLIGEIENVGDNSGIVSAIGLHSGTSSGSDIGMADSDLRYSFSSLTFDLEVTEANLENLDDGNEVVGFRCIRLTNYAY